MNTVRRRWFGVLILGLLLVGVTAWLTFFLARRGLDWSSEFSGIASFALAALVALLTVAGRLALWLPAPRVRDEQIAADASGLAAVLREQGRAKAALPGVGVYDRLPMRVRWESAEVGPGGESTGTFRDVIDSFTGIRDRRLLVLGEAGAGKSVLVSELARRLLGRWRSGDPVPVVFSMVGWDPPATSLFDWMSDQLTRINPDLGKQVSYGRRIVTRAQVLIDRQNVLPILDGLDEVGLATLPAASLAVNRYGWEQPLVVTCRSHDYREATGEEPGTPLAHTTVIELLPLGRDDIERYLGPDSKGRWTAVLGRLAAESDGPLVRTLGNPLMLWLAWEIYRSEDRNPDELADRYRFGRQQAIESRLLYEFVPAVYPVGEQPTIYQPPWSRPPTAGQARRWLGFLASNDQIRTKTLDTLWKRWQSGRLRKPSRDEAVETHDKSVAWWHFTAAVGGLRFAGVAIRATLLWAVIWRQVTNVLGYAGNWSHGTYVGHLPFQRLFLDGPLGRYVWPTVRQAIDVAPAKSRSAAFTNLNDLLRSVLAFPSHHFVFFVIVAIVAMASYANAARPIRPRRLRLRPALPARLAFSIAESIAILAVIALAAMDYWGRTGVIGAFFAPSRTWLALLVLALGSTVYGLPRQLVSEIDVVGATTPSQSLREDRQAAIVTTVLRRVLIAVTLALFCGPLVATSYAVFAFVSTAVMLTLGGLSGFASSSYTDACHWLAMSGRLPWRPMPFLMDAEHRGVFHEIGAVFQFRHIRVQLAMQNWQRANRVRGWEEIVPRLLGRLDEAGLYTSARILQLQVLKRRAQSYTELAKQNPAEFASYLLSALDRQADALAALLRWDEQVIIHGEITATARSMVASGQAPPLTLAGALEQLARSLAQAGLSYEAFGLMTEAADIYHRSTTTDRQQFEQRLAGWIKLFPYDTGERRSTRELIVATFAMADVYRNLVLTDTDSVTPAHADSLVRLASVFQQLNRPDDAASALTDAARVYRQLIHANTTDTKSRDAQKLLDIAGQLQKVGRADEALSALASAADAYWSLAEARPDQAPESNASRAQALTRLAGLRRELDRPGELDAIRQAVEIYRAAAEDVSAEARLSCPPLQALASLTIRLWKLSETHEALAAAHIARQLADIHATGDGIGLDETELPVQQVNAQIRTLLRRSSRYPERTWEPDHSALRSAADQLDTMAFRLLAAGRAAESKAASAAAVSITETVAARCRELAADWPASSLRDLAHVLEELAAYLRRAGSREAEAAAAAAEARDLRLRLGQEPLASQPDTTELDGSADRPAGARWWML